MQRPVLPEDLTWHEGIKSALEDAQFQQCRDRVVSWPGTGIFDTGSVLEAEWLRQHSYYSRENGKAAGADVKNRILENVRKEALCLSMDEDTLVKRMLLTDGTVYAGDWQMLPAVESLLKRLWCTLRTDENGEETLVLAEELRGPLLEAMSGERYVPVRETLFRMDAMLNCMLYLYGYVFPEPILNQVIAKAESWMGILEYPHLRRYVMAAFPYVVTGNGTLLLTHSALRVTGGCLERIYQTDASDWKISGEMMLGGMNSLLAEEKPAVDLFVSTIRKAVRPENDLQTLTDDLRFMAKQGASFADMKKILAESLCVLPDRGMLDALERLRQETMPWILFSSEGLN